MLKLKTCFALLLLLSAFCLSSTEASPFLWLLGVRSGRSRGYNRQAAPQEKSYGDICRVHNPIPGESYGLPLPCPQ